MVTIKQLNESLSRLLYEGLSIEEAIKEELHHQRYEICLDETEISQLSVLEKILELYNDLDYEDRNWLEKVLNKPSISKNEKVAIFDIFRSIGEENIPFDLGEDDFYESLNKINEEINCIELSPDFDINNIEDELIKRYDSLEYLIDNRYDVEDHYINRFNFDLAMIKKMLKEDIESLDFTNEEAVKLLFDKIDGRIHHAEGYIGLPG